MSYFITKTIETNFDEAIQKVTEALTKEGFGIVTDFNVSNAFKNKLGIDFRPYRVLGACNPPFAREAIDAEENIGVLLPCNVVIQQKENEIIVSAVNPTSTMEAVNNEKVSKVANKIHDKLKKVFEAL